MQPVGLLVSQIGYDLEASMRALYRGPLPDGAVFRLHDAASGEIMLEKPLVYWGNCWQSDWWVADFSELDRAGEFTLTVEADRFPAISCPPFKVADYLLWDATIRDVAIAQFERRAEESRFGRGWRDCGAEWREAGSHSGALIGLLDLLYLGHRWLGREDAERLTKQIIHGCDFLVECQRRASDLGYPTGSLVHEIPSSAALIPQDHGQAAVALAKAARLIYEYDPVRSMDYLNRAAQAYEYFTRQSRPGTLPHFSAQLHGAPDGYVPTSFMTGDLMMMVWGGVELAHSGRPEYLDEAVHRAREVLRRQVSKDEAEGGLYGHFYTFADRLFTEKAFIHHHVGHDTSVMFNHYIVPLMELYQRHTEHPDAPRWRQTVHDFAYGYFLPACRQNPFFLLPQGYYAGQGLLTFGGPWHGFNVIYGYAAALAVQFEYFFDDHQFREIAVGNLQWLAGLNSGMTADSFDGSLMWQEHIPEGEAVPYSMIHGIGHHAVKTWSQITGSIGNGYCTNRQFHMDLEPTVEHDIPLRYSDEDWIPHAGGWASGLAYFHHIMTWLPLGR